MEELYLTIGEDKYDLYKEDGFYIYDGILEKEKIDTASLVEIYEGEQIISFIHPSFYIYRVTDDKTYFVLKDNPDKVEDEKNQSDQILISYVANYLVPEEVALQVPDIFDEWQPGVQYNTDQKVRYDGGLWKCLQSHTSQSDWAPGVAPSLWTKISDPSVEYPEWVQPTGAHDAYAKGDKVSYNGKKWVSTADANVWAPGTYGWDEVA